MPRQQLPCWERFFVFRLPLFCMSCQWLPFWERFLRQASGSSDAVSASFHFTSLSLTHNILWGTSSIRFQRRKSSCFIAPLRHFSCFDFENTFLFKLHRLLMPYSWLPFRGRFFFLALSAGPCQRVAFCERCFLEASTSNFNLLLCHVSGFHVGICVFSSCSVLLCLRCHVSGFPFGNVFFFQASASSDAMSAVSIFGLSFTSSFNFLRCHVSGSILGTFFIQASASSDAMSAAAIAGTFLFSGFNFLRRHVTGFHFGNLLFCKLQLFPMPCQWL